MSTEHYTEADRKQLWDDWLDRMVEVEPSLVESIIKGVIAQQKELGLIGPRRKLPDHLHQMEAGKE